ncbi:hypothetical protein [Streptococcus hyointestinalis]|uniref:hypothetical protein n=1 Tax=Streptococcus hyointestinalis TaxID=1337 RepID=UPI0013E075F1|nr:hypothetical protein [Streptococcus hyointestinalis]
MDDWKTMLEVAKELNITKSLVRYHRQKLTNSDVKMKNGVTYISPQGIVKIKSFLRSSDYSDDFETIVKNQLNLIQDLLVTSKNLPEKNTKETIESFREFLIRTPDSLVVLQELERQSHGTIDSEFYFSLIDYLERKNGTIDNFFS